MLPQHFDSNAHLHLRRHRGDWLSLRLFYRRLELLGRAFDCEENVAGRA